MTDGGSGGRSFIIGVMAIQLACVGWVVGTSFAKRHALGRLGDALFAEGCGVLNQIMALG